jgi:hypothetical protein
MTQRYSAAQGRKFGLTVGIAFGILAGLSYWRGHGVVPLVAGAIALALVVAALAAPRALEPVERAWMKLAHVISRVTTPIFMGIVYFAVLTPIGIVRRTFGRNPLVHEPDGGSYWIARTPVERERKRIRMERQF